MFIPDAAMKLLLEVIDDVGWWLHHHEDEEEARQLLERLRAAKHQVEEQAKNHDR